MQTPKVKIVIDLGFGDSGKGALVDFLTREFSGPVVNVRFNGGAQAAHNVVLPDGRHHTFSQFGSGSFNTETITYLTEDVIFDPVTILTESKHLQKVIGPNDPVLQRLFIHPRCKIATPFHKAINRANHMARTHEISSCGMGISTVMDFEQKDLPTIRAEDLKDKKYLNTILGWMKKECLDIFEGIKRNYYLTDPEKIQVMFKEDMADFFLQCIEMVVDSVSIRDDFQNIADGKNIVMEGAQGVLLDENFGFHPYNTWSTCTEKNAVTFLREHGLYSDYPQTEVIGIIRSYLTRHGAGPFPSEANLRSTNELHNSVGIYQGAFREGFPDMLLLRYALRCCSIDSICISHTDKVQSNVCTSYKTKTHEIKDLFPAEELNGRLYKERDFNMFSSHADDLCRLLRDSVPVYEQIGDQSIVDVVERETHHLVSITGSGPTFENYRRIRRADTSRI